MEPTDGAKRPVRRDLCKAKTVQILHCFFFFFLTHFFVSHNVLVHFPAAFFVAFWQRMTTSAETVIFKIEMQVLQLRKTIRLITTTLHFQCQVEQNNLPVSSKLLR